MVLIGGEDMNLEEQIQKSAEIYARYNSRANNTAYYAYIEGAQSMLPKIEELTKRSNKWIKCSEQLPKKVDERIRSNAILVSITGDDWTVAEYHFGDKQWINLLGERETIEPKYWQEVNLPEKELEK